MPRSHYIIGVLVRFSRDRDGSTAIEYAMIAGLIFLAAVAGITTFTEATNQLYIKIASNVLKSTQ